MERSERLYQHPTSSDKSIEGCFGEVTTHQMACHFRFHSCRTHEKSAMDCSRTQVEKEMKAMTPVEATRRCAGEKGCPDICPASPSREIVWKILVVHGKICYHRGIRVAG